jgi:glycosyltransferase involved in cell wall biosynthesis
MISFIVPAHNEQQYVGRTLEAIRESAGAAGQAYEVIVVDDASTDATAAVAAQHQATVRRVEHRQIAATRNSGARAASGERLFFVDADTLINPRVLAAAMRAMDKGAAGGGAPARFDGPVPLYARLLLLWINFFMRLGGMTGGACMFCRREAFEAVGGFNEKLFGAEDAVMSLELKREGRFVVLWPHVFTSGRRVRGMGGLQMLAALVRMGFTPGMLTRRSSVEKIWYESNRESDDKIPNTLGVRLSNAAMLVILIALFPIWIFVPWSMTPRESVLGQIRIYTGLIGCHVSLVLWPCAYFLSRSLLRQTRWNERIKLAVLIALCLWLAWGGTREVVWFWSDLVRWLVN